MSVLQPENVDWIRETGLLHSGSIRIGFHFASGASFKVGVAALHLFKPPCPLGWSLHGSQHLMLEGGKLRKGLLCYNPEFGIPSPGRLAYPSLTFLFYVCTGPLKVVFNVLTIHGFEGPNGVER